MSEPVIVTIPVRTQSEANSRDHWRKKATRVKTQRYTVAKSLDGISLPPLPLRVCMTRVAPRQLDDDNLRSALKATRDEIATWIGVDDRDSRVLWCYMPEARGEVGTYAVRVEVSTIEGPEGAAILASHKPSKPRSPEAQETARVKRKAKAAERLKAKQDKVTAKLPPWILARVKK